MCYCVIVKVKDAACVASGRFVCGFPDESKPFLSQLYPLWFQQLGDAVWSLREDAAIALGDVISGLGEDALAVVLPVLTQYLDGAKDEPCDEVYVVAL